MLGTPYVELVNHSATRSADAGACIGPQSNSNVGGTGPATPSRADLVRHATPHASCSPGPNPGRRCDMRRRANCTWRTPETALPLNASVPRLTARLAVNPPVVAPLRVCRDGFEVCASTPTVGLLEAAATSAQKARCRRGIPRRLLLQTTRAAPCAGQWDVVRMPLPGRPRRKTARPHHIHHVLRKDERPLVRDQRGGRKLTGGRRRRTPRHRPSSSSFCCSFTATTTTSGRRGQRGSSSGGGSATLRRRPAILTAAFEQAATRHCRHRRLRQQQWQQQQQQHPRQRARPPPPPTESAPSGRTPGATLPRRTDAVTAAALDEAAAGAAAAAAAAGVAARLRHRPGLEAGLELRLGDTVENRIEFPSAAQLSQAAQRPAGGRGRRQAAVDPRVKVAKTRDVDNWAAVAIHQSSRIGERISHRRNRHLESLLPRPQSPLPRRRLWIVPLKTAGRLRKPTTAGADADGRPDRMPGTGTLEPAGLGPDAASASPPPSSPPPPPPPPTHSNCPLAYTRTHWATIGSMLPPVAAAAAAPPPPPPPPPPPLLLLDIPPPPPPREEHTATDVERPAMEPLPERIWCTCREAATNCEKPALFTTTVHMVTMTTPTDLRCWPHGRHRTSLCRLARIRRHRNRRSSSTTTTSSSKTGGAVPTVFTVNIGSCRRQSRRIRCVTLGSARQKPHHRQHRLRVPCMEHRIHGLLLLHRLVLGVDAGGTEDGATTAAAAFIELGSNGCRIPWLPPGCPEWSPMAPCQRIDAPRNKKTLAVLTRLMGRFGSPAYLDAAVSAL
ncbi:hypothetical protein BU14_0091s0015 [Porphyra umbilicalis]|uniref:Uncharacterized protein n=1 Tax=Porphyra umbilicalis TaxID=2786 RepID=A0A1X6PE91_PORUM|nr:hypothetical protein BU14_0091s0015 [Porphyra umbilicalis]|eukprot:OSX79035.1 hypothetical protein BU14_0091s0015 [Porphyra umbilicalis]